MLLRSLILLRTIAYAATQYDNRTKCVFWGDPHINPFPDVPGLASSPSGYWCQTPGRHLLVKNELIEFYVDVTGHPYLSENYEINFLSNGTKLCTITPNSDNCTGGNVVNVSRPRCANGNNLQIFHKLVDDFEIVITSQNVDAQRIYNFEVIHSYDLNRASTGLCATRSRQCQLESSGRRKRSIAVSTAYQVCDVYIDEANKTAKQITNGTKSTLITHAREACVNDILTTNQLSWAESAAWLILTDNIRKSGFSTDQQRVLMMNLSSSIATTVNQARPKAEGIMGIMTITDTSDIAGTTLTPSPSSSTTTTTSSSTKTELSIVLGLLTLLLLMFCGSLPQKCLNATIELQHHKQFSFDCIRSDKNCDAISLAPHCVIEPSNEARSLKM